LETSSNISVQYIVFNKENDRQNWFDDNNFSKGNIIFENSNEDDVSIEDLLFLMFQLKLVNFVKTFYERSTRGGATAQQPLSQPYVQRCYKAGVRGAG